MLKIFLRTVRIQFRENEFVKMYQSLNWAFNGKISEAKDPMTNKSQAIPGKTRFACLGILWTEKVLEDRNAWKDQGINRNFIFVS